MARPTVIVENRFRQYADDLARGVERALEHAAADGAAAARGASTRGYHIESITQQTRPGRPVEDMRGWEAPILNPDFRARFFEYGTLGRRGRKTKRPRKLPTTTAAGKKRGVRPVRFLAAGRKAAAQTLIRHLERELRG